MDKGGQEMQDHGTFLLPGFYIPHEKLKVIEDFLSSGFHVMLTANLSSAKS